eukprot:652912-Lingulodinium_polyedra.AAC.1
MENAGQARALFFSQGYGRGGRSNSAGMAGVPSSPRSDAVFGFAGDRAAGPIAECPVVVGLERGRRSGGA